MRDIPKGSIATLILAAWLAGVPALAVGMEVAGVQVPEQLTEGGRTLVLNGAGLRTKFVVKVYVAALYVSAKSQSAAALIESGEPRRLRLRLLRDVDSNSLDAALQSGLRDNIGKQELAALQPRVARLSALMAEIGTAREGDVIDLDFDADGVTLTDNGAQRGRIDDPAFARALLQVWLGDDPAQSSLKKALLGSP